MLTWLDETGWYRGPALGPRGGMAEQQPVIAVDDRHDHRRVGAREVLGTTMRAAADPTGIGDLGRPAAPRTAGVGSVPVRQRDRLGGKTGLPVAEVPADISQLGQSAARESLWIIGAPGTFGALLADTDRKSVV